MYRYESVAMHRCESVAMHWYESVAMHKCESVAMLSIIQEHSVFVSTMSCQFISCVQ